MTAKTAKTAKAASTTFQDRAHAGRELAAHLERFAAGPPVVVGIAPGGVPVAYEISRAHDAPLEAWGCGTKGARPASSGAFHHGPHVPMRNETVLLVDDGLSTVATLRDAIRTIRQEKPHRVLVAAPVLVVGAAEHLDPYVDALVRLHERDSLHGAESTYQRAEALDDAQVAAILDRRRAERTTRPSIPPGVSTPPGPATGKP